MLRQQEPLEWVYDECRVSIGIGIEKSGIFNEMGSLELAGS